MKKRVDVYEAALFRGWEVVRMRYAIEGDEVVMKRKGTWGAEQETRVRMRELDGEVRRVWARQKAYWVSIFALLAVAAVVGLELVKDGPAKMGERFGEPAVAGVILLGFLAWLVMWLTRKPAEWTHFGSKSGKGLYVLVNRRNRKGHAAFVEAVRGGR